MNYKDKKISYFNSKIVLLLIIVAGVLLAILSTAFFARVDLTEEKVYVISDSTKNILKKLDDPVNIRVYFSEKLPPNLLQVRQYVADILGEYKAYAKSNLVVKYMDPEKEDVAREALSYGIPQIQMNVYTKDKFEVQNGFLGIAILFEDKVETIPVVENVMNLEYDLTSAILKVSTGQVKTVGFLKGHDEKSIEGAKADYEQFAKTIRKNYNVKSVDLSQADALKDVNTLIVAGPKTALADKEIYAIDQFITKGGNAIFLVDQVGIDDGLQTSEITGGLDDFIENMGVTVEKNLVLDQSNENISFSQGYMTFIVPYPFWVKLIPKNFQKDSPILAKLNSIVLPWSSALSISKKEGLEVTELAKTTANSYVQVSPFDVNPNAQSVQSQQKGNIPMIALISGTYKSYYTGRTPEGMEKADADFRESSLSPVKILVIGNSRLIENRFLMQAPQNLNFLMNTVDYMTMDESLIGIRSKTMQIREIEQLSDSGRLAAKFFGIYLMPILVIVFGLIRAYFFKKMRMMRSMS